MALYLNLYHEIQKQKLKRQRDPLKIAIMGMVVIAVALVAWYFYRMESVTGLMRVASDKVNEMKTLAPQAETAQKEHDTYDSEIKLADTIIHRMENRFYWAPLLEQIIQVVPAEVQISGLEGSISPDGLKKVTLTINGLATGSEPRAVAEQMRMALLAKLSPQYHLATAVFRSLEDSPETVQYQGKSSPTVQFIIDVTFTSPDVREVDKAAQAPPARIPRS